MRTRVRIILSPGAAQPSAQALTELWNRHLAADDCICAEATAENIGREVEELSSTAWFISFYDIPQDIGLVAFFPTSDHRDAFLKQPDFSDVEVEVG